MLQSQPDLGAHYPLECSRRYHHDFYVGQDQLRVYYDRLPDILQLSEHHFAETRLIDLWRMTMVNGWYV